MKMKQVEYEKVYIDDDPEKRQELLEKTGAMTVPITTDGKTFVVGWNPAHLANLVSLV